MVHRVICPGFGVGAAIRLFHPLAPDCCSMIPKLGDTARTSVRFRLHILSCRVAENFS